MAGDEADHVRLTRAFIACAENAERLVEDAELLVSGSYPTAFAIAVLAQEEFAKAFLLYLVHQGVVPWDAHVLRSLRDRSCKHLLGLMMDFLSPSIDEFLARLDKRRREQKGNTPGGSERVMVCLSSRSPHAGILLRKAVLELRQES